MTHSTTRLAAIAALLGLTSCTSTDDLRLRAALGVGPAELTATSLGESVEFDGIVGTLRVEVARRPEDLPNLEVGVRLIGDYHSFEETQNGVTAGIDATSLAGVLVIRPYFPIGAATRAYLEGFAGYRHSWADLSLSDGLGGFYDERGRDGGLLFGLGAGMEFDISNDSALFFGLEWSRNLTDEGGLDLDVDDFMLTVGWSTTF